MTGYRHRSNAELVGQGAANIASALFGGIPATGAIARTATNIRSGARSPIAGMLHAAFLLAFMLLAAPLAAYVPLASLAAVLTVVAWNMSDAPRFLHLMSAPLGDRLVLILTFSLTVLVDLTVAIQVGVVLAAVLFMHRMAEVAGIERLALAEDGNGETSQRVDLPPGVEVFQMQGPLFFGVTHRLTEVLKRIDRTPRVFILRMRLVPMIDASGVSALGDFVAKCAGQGTRVIFSGMQPPIAAVMARMGLTARIETAPDFSAALARAREIVGG
jgi:SulP family sulfate permease